MDEIRAISSIKFKEHQSLINPSLSKRQISWLKSPLSTSENQIKNKESFKKSFKCCTEYDSSKIKIPITSPSKTSLLTTFGRKKYDEHKLSLSFDIEKKKKYILLVDDEEMNIEVLSLFIARYLKSNHLFDFETLSATEFNQSCQIVDQLLLEKKNLVIVLTDFNLDRRKTGLDLNNYIKKKHNEAKKTIPKFLLVSGEKLSQKPASNFYAMIQKPFSYEKFVNKFQKVVYEI